MLRISIKRNTCTSIGMYSNAIPNNSSPEKWLEAFCKWDMFATSSLATCGRQKASGVCIPTRTYEHMQGLNQPNEQCSVMECITLPLAPVIWERLRFVTTSLKYRDFCGCCHAHSNCSAWVCNLWTQCKASPNITCCQGCKESHLIAGVSPSMGSHI